MEYTREEKLNNDWPASCSPARRPKSLTKKRGSPDSSTKWKTFYRGNEEYQNAGTEQRGFKKATVSYMLIHSLAIATSIKQEKRNNPKA